MRFACLCFALLLGVWGFAPVLAQDKPMVESGADGMAPPTDAVKPPPVVLELFSSQGCAFCPPADQLMGQMIQQQSVIGLSCHVDYFGVKENSLGKSFCTQRQGNYNRLIGTGPRYTPELVINGHMDMIGYEAGKISAAILKARSEKVKNIELTANGSDGYSFNLPEIKIGADPVRLWVAVYDAPHSIAITEGSNFGKKITYYNVVSKIDDLGAWDGKAMARSITAGFKPESGGLAVIVQDTKTGHILAAGSVNRAASTPLASLE